MIRHALISTVFAAFGALLSAQPGVDPFYGVPYVTNPQAPMPRPTPLDAIPSWRPCCWQSPRELPHIIGYYLPNVLVPQQPKAGGASWFMSPSQDVNVFCGDQTETWQYVWFIGGNPEQNPVFGLWYECGASFLSSFADRPWSVHWAPTAPIVFPQTIPTKYGRPSVGWQIPLTLAGQDIIVQITGSLWVTDPMGNFTRKGAFVSWALKARVL